MGHPSERISQFKSKTTERRCFLYLKNGLKMLGSRFYKVATNLNIFATTLFRAMFIIHENIYIYGRISLEKIPVFRQKLQCQMDIIQNFWPHSSDLQYIGQNEVALHFFKVTNWPFLLFLWLLGSNRGFLKCAGLSEFLDES